MSIVAQLGDVKERYERVEQAADFVACARLLLAGGDRQFLGARDLSRIAPRVSARVKSIFAAPEAAEIFVHRAAVPPMTLPSSPALTAYAIAANGFASSLANVGVFDRLLGGGFRVVPLSLLNIGAVNVGVAAFTIPDEAAPKPVSSFSVSSATTTPRKSGTLLILTAELARAIEGPFDALIGQELRKGVVKDIDQKFLAVAVAGAPSFAASGSNLPAFFGDLAAALNSLAIDDTARLYIVMTSANAKQLALMLAQGSATSTAMMPGGGQIAGIEVIVSDALAAGQWVLLDASAFACAADLLTLSPFRHASVQFDTSPDSPATASTNFISLWQLNQLGLLAERFFIAERLRSNSVAQITGASYASGFSP